MADHREGVVGRAGEGREASRLNTDGVQKMPTA